MAQVDRAEEPQFLHGFSYTKAPLSSLTTTWTPLTSSALEPSVEKQDNLKASATHKQEVITWYLFDLITHDLCCLCDICPYIIIISFSSLINCYVWEIIICQLRGTPQEW